MPEFFIEETCGPVRLIQFNRPPSNGLTSAFMRSLREKISVLSLDDSVGAVVFSTAIPKYFSSGIDLDEFFSLPQERRGELFEELLTLYRALVLCPKPTVAAISGYALLGGWITAMGCDFLYMAQENGKMALSEIKLGISPTATLVRAIAGRAASQAAVKELIMTGKTFRAEEALEAGFVDRLFPAGSLLQESLKQAERLAEMPSQAYVSVKRSYKEWLLGDLDSMLVKSRKEFEEIFNGPEAREGFAAVREKRRPRFH